MAFLLIAALAALPCFAAPAAPDAAPVSAPGDDCAGAPAGASYCADWGQDYQAKLQKIFDTIIGASGYDSFFARLFRGRTELQYHGDETLVNESPAYGIAPDCGPNHSDHPIIAVGSSIFDIAKTNDELAFVLAHEAGHLVKEHCEKKKEFLQAMYSKWRKDHPELDGYDPDVRQGKFKKEIQPRMEAVQRCVERQADDVGRDIMSKAGLSASAAGNTFRHTADWAWALGAVDQADSTHDSMESRAQRADAGAAGGGGGDGEDCFKLE